MIGWAWFVIVQAVTLVFTVIGWVLLILPCVLEQWEPWPSPFPPPRMIDRWSGIWRWLNFAYGNPEDGVSGRYALIWSGGKQVPYMQGAWPPWRAYCWSAWRNSADNLKYIFQWKDGPFFRKEFGSHYVQLGWNSRGLPTISAGSI